MSIDILRRSGGWCVELQYPLRGHAGDISAIEIRRPTGDHVIRWGEGAIVSLLALLSELSDVPEKLLRQLPSNEFDRVIFALLQTIPAAMKADLEKGERPLATPEYELPPSERVPAPDQIDPRFPAVDGPVQRIRQEPPAVVPAADGSGMNLTAPSVSQPVH
jgi:hypothetical protein